MVSISGNWRTLSSKESALSGLNRVLIGILIVLSLLLSSAVIVWVNKTEDFKKAEAAATEKAARETKAREVASNEAGAAKEALAAAIKTYNAQVEQLQGELKNKDQEISKVQVQLADLSGQFHQSTITLAATGEALKASEAQKKLQVDQLAELRLLSEKIQKEKSDLNQALSETTNKLDVMTREWKFMKEQLAESQGTADKLAGQVKDLGGSPNTATPGLKLGAPAINGVIREVRKMDDNRNWATISIGSAESVTKGMEFKVIDRNSGSFLGILTVQNVEANEAVGTLSGPKVGDVKVGNEVRTQL